MSARGGIDLGGTKIQAVVVGDDHAVLGEARRPTPTVGLPEDVTVEIVLAVREACESAGVAPDELRGIGVGSPGDVGVDTVTQARNLPGWEGTFPLGRVLAETLGTRVALGNDVQVATDAEFALGVGQPYASLLGVFWGTGVGGGLVLDERPWVGRGAGGEIGHMVVVEGGEVCPCGRRGCMEAYAGRKAMEARARAAVAAGRKTKLFEIMERRGRTRLASGVWARALDQGDELAHELVDRAVSAIGACVASCINLLDIEAVVIGGGMGIRLGQPYADRIAAAMSANLFADDRPPEVRVAQLGDLGGAIGAALLVRETAELPA